MSDKGIQAPSAYSSKRNSLDGGVPASATGVATEKRMSGETEIVTGRSVSQRLDDGLPDFGARRYDEPKSAVTGLGGATALSGKTGPPAGVTATGAAPATSSAA